MRMELIDTPARYGFGECGASVGRWFLVRVLNAMMATRIPRITFSRITTGPEALRTNGEIINHIPSSTTSADGPKLRPERLKASRNMAAPVATLFHMMAV